MTNWRPANNGTGKFRWFVYRDPEDPHTSVQDRYYWRDWSKGLLHKYASCDSALKVAERLNAVLSIERR